MQKTILSRFARDKKTPHERLCDYYVNRSKAMKHAKCYSVLPTQKKSGITQYTNYEILKQLANI